MAEEEAARNDSLTRPPDESASTAAVPVHAADENDDSDEEPEYPKRMFVYMLLIITNEAISVSMLYPYVGLYIVHLRPEMDKRDAGRLSGLIVGSFQIAQAIFAARWGRLSDRWGRRPMIAVGLIFSALFAFLFGLSSAVWQLLLFRFCYGAANGNAPLTKTMVAEMTCPKTDAFGWAMMSAGWALGSTLGPMLGGLLYAPAESMPSLFAGTIFEAKPALLPGIAGAAYSLFALGVTAFCLPETNKRARPPAWLVGILGERLAGSPVAAEDDAGPDGDVALAPVVAGSPTSPGDSGGGGSPATELSSPASPSTRASQAPEEAAAAYGIWAMVAAPRMRRFLLVYVNLAWINTTLNEVFPLLAITPVHQGGLGVSASTIGVIYTLWALFNMSATPMFQPAAARYGRLALQRVSLLAIAGSMLAHAALPAVPWDGSVLGIVIGSCVASGPRVIFAMFGFSLATMGIAASAPAAHLGHATGISHSMGNVARAVMPSMFTWLFAWSVSGDPAAAPHSSEADGHAAHTGGEHAPSAGAHAALTGAGEPSPAAPATDGEPQGLLGPWFPFNRWFVFILLAAAAVITATFTARLQDADFVREAPKRKKGKRRGVAGTSGDSSPAISASASAADLASKAAPVPASPSMRTEDKRHAAADSAECLPPP